MTVFISRPRKDTACVGPVMPPPGLLVIPGVCLVWTPECDDYASVELPKNTWNLPEVLDFFRVVGVSPPTYPPSDLHVTSPLLRDYQETASNFILDNEGVLLGDQPGLGKTRTSVLAADAYRNHSGCPDRPILIIGPKYLRSTWQQELELIGAISDPDEFHALSGRSLDYTNWKHARYYYCHYDIVATWWPLLWQLKPMAAIVDEAHLLKNSRTKRAKGVHLATAACPLRVGLTGTPILNRIGELWNLLNITSGMWGFGTPVGFRRRYAGAQHIGYGWEDTRPTHTEELKTRLSGCYLRRTLADIDIDLPPISRQVLEVPLSDKQAEKYAALLEGRNPRDVAKAILEGRASKKTLSWLIKIRKLTSRVKLPVTVEQTQSLREEQEDVVVFSWERATADKIIAKCDGAGFVVHGGYSQEERDIRVGLFQEHGGLLAATYGALSIGVNLQKARVVILHDLDWTPATLLQAEARVWRQGQTKPVISKWIVAKDTIDALLVKHLITKADWIAAALGDEEPTNLANLFQDSASNVEEELIELIERWRKY